MFRFKKQTSQNQTDYRIQLQIARRIFRFREVKSAKTIDVIASNNSKNIVRFKPNKRAFLK